MAEISGPVSPSEGDSLNRYFSGSKTALQAAAKERKKPGRKPKVRHDIDMDDVPIDGDYKLLEVTNENKEFVYKWLSDSDRARLVGYRYQPELWGPDCCRPKLWFGEQKVGTEIRVNELVLHKIPRARDEKIRAAERFRHDELTKGLLDRAKQSGGFAKVVTHEVSA